MTIAEIDRTEALHRVIEIEVVEDYRVAVDIGAGRGEWSALMAVHFARVVAFEPNRERFQALLSVADAGHIDCHCRAVVDRSGLGVDDLDLDFCGLIRVDAGGAELLALRSAEKTIRRYRPVLIVTFAGKSSRHGHTDRMIQGHLLASGYRELFRSGVDRVFVPK